MPYNMANVQYIDTDSWYFYEAVEAWKHNSEMREILAWNWERKNICSRAMKVWNMFPINIWSSKDAKLFKPNYVNYLEDSYIGPDYFSISSVNLTWNLAQHYSFYLLHFMY